MTPARHRQPLDFFTLTEWRELRELAKTDPEEVRATLALRVLDRLVAERNERSTEPQ